MSPRSNGVKELLRLSDIYKSSTQLQGQKDRAFLTQLKNTFNNLKNSLLIWDIVQRQRWLNQNADKMYLLYERFNGKYASNQEPIKNYYSAPFNGFMNIFQLQYGSAAYFKGIVSVLLERFIAGITHFKTDGPAGKPVYHRKESCGVKSKNWAAKFFQLDNTNIDQEVAKALRICYIERAIFNQIYEKVFDKKQDKGHLEEFERMKRLHDTMFQFDNLHIYVNFKLDEIVPKELLIIYHHQGHIISETYTKLNATDTMATRTVRGTTNVDFHKIQSVRFEQPWIRVRRGGRKHLKVAKSPINFLSI